MSQSTVSFSRLTPLAILLAVLGVAFAVLAVAFPSVLDVVYKTLGPSEHISLGADGRVGAGIYGGFMAGWGVQMTLFARGVGFGRASALGLIAWWVVDSTTSILTGYPYNALSNTLCLLVFVPALGGHLRRGT